MQPTAMVFTNEGEPPAARRWLAERDSALARIDAALAEVPWRARPGGFAGLVRLIVEQQVSTHSAAAIRARLETGLGETTPAAVLARTEAELKGFGLSAPKARYVRALAIICAEGGFDADGLRRLDDEAAVLALTALPGVGRWTAEVYLLFCEGRADVFPAGDLALQEGLRIAEGADVRLDARAISRRAEAWRPHRGLAAHLIWAYYAQNRAKAPASLPEIAPA